MYLLAIAGSSETLLQRASETETPFHKGQMLLGQKLDFTVKGAKQKLMIISVEKKNIEANTAAQGEHTEQIENRRTKSYPAPCSCKQRK